MPNPKTLKIGRSDFELIIKNNHYFVDKTMLIPEFFHNANDVLLMPRPKRFGKTLNLSMIEHFFDSQKPESASLFSEFLIAQETDFCRQHQNKYPLINISLKKVKATNWLECLDSFKTAIVQLYQKHDYLLKSDKLKSYETHRIEEIISRTAIDNDYKFSLQQLSEYLHKHFGETVIILVDEYDAPIINAFKNTPTPIKGEKGQTTYYEEVISFMQIFLGEAFKGNKSLRKGLLTGVMRVGRESIFSEWNNFSVYGITSAYFSDKFGFTQAETEKIVSYFGLQTDMHKIEQWYNGYKFGNTDKIYNPWSIVNYIANHIDGFVPYWVNTGDTALIKERITESNIKEKIQDLIEGREIEEKLNDNFIFSDFETDSQLLWTLLTYNGYLTQINKSKYGSHLLKIPNNEVKMVFTDIILAWLNDKVKIRRDLLISTAENLINNRLQDFELSFKLIIGDTLSYFDTAKNENSTVTEQIYHIYTLGLLTILTDDYVIRSNRESGQGRYDIMLIPHDKKNNGVVIEIKQVKPQDTKEKASEFAQRINEALDEAYNQIETKKYYQELIAHHVPAENIIKVPIIFAGKEPFINKMELT